MRSHCDLPRGEMNIYPGGSSDPHRYGYSQVAQLQTASQHLCDDYDPLFPNPR